MGFKPYVFYPKIEHNSIDINANIFFDRLTTVIKMMITIVRIVIVAFMIVAIVVMIVTKEE